MSGWSIGLVSAILWLQLLSVSLESSSPGVLSLFPSTYETSPADKILESIQSSPGVLSLFPSTYEACPDDKITAWEVSVPINTNNQHVSEEVSKYILGACVSGNLTLVRDAVSDYSDGVFSSVFNMDSVGEASDDMDLIRCHVRCHDNNCYSYCDTGRTEATCLSIAVDHGYHALASYLISKGADIEWQPRQRGFPMLHHAVMNDDMRMILDLIRHGASTTAENWLGDNVNIVLDGRYHLWDICSPGRAAAMTARKDVRKNQIAAARKAYLDQKHRFELD